MNDGPMSDRDPVPAPDPNGDRVYLEDLRADPVEQFREWFAHAAQAGQPEPEAMAVATSPPDGHPSLRWVLLRGFDQRGFVFYTNRRSRKGGELTANPHAAAGFRWYVVDRQVRIVGPVSEVDDVESDAYFAGRPRGSQIGAWSSDQSQPVADRSELERRVAEAEARFGDGPVPRPPWWGGYRIDPVEMEFWQQGPFRVHDRFRYRRRPDGGWDLTQLFP